MNVTEIRVVDIVIPPKRMRRLRPDTVAEIAKSIAAQELQQPIIVRPRGAANYWLVAGRHRLEAVRQCGHTHIHAVVRNGLDADAAQLAEIDENLIRADLSPAERALHVARRKELYEKLYPETKHGGDRKSAKTKSRSQNENLKNAFVADVAKKIGKGRSTVARDVIRAKKVVVLADIVGTAPEDEQRKLAARAKAGEKVQVKVAVKKLQRERREIELADATHAASQELGKKLYGVIYTDCPWQYDNVPFGDLGRAVEAHFPTMTLDQIKALPVPAADNCALFLWATIPLLEKAFAVIGAWGFDYRSAIAWEKDKIGIGYWTRSQLELLLIGTRGNIPTPAPGDQLPAIIKAPRGGHSEKPDIFADEIARLFPNVPKLEMFARKARPGWDVWGNETPAMEAAS
jgi:N6-adenosine-specific RNA methylase IME4